jgi:transcriptional regulator with XRE-family HTH domain
MSPADVYRALGANAARRRRELGLTQAAVAASIGLTRASLANIETGRQQVMLHQVYLLADALGLDSIEPLAPGMVRLVLEGPPLPMNDERVTATQRKQIERTVQLALTHGRPAKRKSP